MLNKKLLTMIALAVGMLLPQGAWADGTKTLTPEVLYSLTTTGYFGTDNGNNSFTKDGVNYEKSTVSNTDDDSHAPQWWRYQANSAYIGCPLGSALAAGDVIEITARASSASSSLYFILRDNNFSTADEEKDIKVTLGSTSDKTYTYTVTAADNLVGKDKFYLMGNFTSSYKIRVGLIRVLRNRTTPNPITRSTTWNFYEYNTASATTAPMVCDNLYFGTGIQIMNQTVDGNYNVVNLNGAKGAEDYTHSLIFYVPAGSGKFTIEFIPNSGYASSHSSGKKAYYKIGDNAAVLMEYISENGKKLNTLSDVAYNVATATPIMLYTSATGQYLIKSISVTPDVPTIPITTIDYATFSSPLDLDFSGCSQKAYIVTGEDKGILTYQQVTKVPAGTGLLLVGAAGDNVSPTILSGDADDVSGNLLKPTLTATTVGTTTGADYGKVWVLGNKNSTPGFYKSNNGRSLAVGKAYLYLDGGISEAREFYAFDFEDETTGISNSKLGIMNSDQVFFDLQGRRVAQPTKGLYIVNGKKVIIK